MKAENMNFGQYIKHLRLKDSREPTLKEVAEELGISLSMLSDIENGRRRAFDSEKIEQFVQYLNLSVEEKAHMYDLAAIDRGEVPSDIEDTLMYTKIGNMARLALRQSNAGAIDEEDWKRFIREIEEKKHD